VARSERIRRRRALIGLLPALDGRLAFASHPGDRHSARTPGGPQHQLHPADMVLRAFGLRDHVLQPFAITRPKHPMPFPMHLNPQIQGSMGIVNVDRSTNSAYVNNNAKGANTECSNFHTIT
jgi:hypothetical protein